MKRMPYILTALSIGLGVALLFGGIITLSPAQASSPQATARQNAILMDTSATMGQEITRFAAAHNNLTRPLTETVTTHMLQFRDEAQYNGSTQDQLLASAWLSDLTAAGGGACPDAGLQALRELAQNAETDSANPLNALLVSDAAPQGRRQHLVELADGLIKRDISVSVLQSGWCNDAQLSAEELEHLTMFTGGSWYQANAASYYTTTQIALQVLESNALITSISGHLGPDDFVEHSFEVDPSIQLLLTEETSDPFLCLTCTLRVADSQVAPISNLDVKLIAPQGFGLSNLIDGYKQLQSDRYRSQSFNGCLTCTLRTADSTVPQTWKVILTGSGPFTVNVLGISDLNLAYTGPRSMKANQLVSILARLTTEPLTSTFKLVSLDGATTVPITLYDDGNHNDGSANDGLYGGDIVAPAAGRWRLGVTGELPNGRAFQRLDAAPIIVRDYLAPTPASKVSVAGSTESVTFSISRDPATVARQASATTYDVSVFSEQGWVVTSTVPTSITVADGETVDVTVPVLIPTGAAVGSAESVKLVLSPTNDFGQSTVVIGEVKVTGGFSHKVMLPILTR